MPTDKLKVRSLDDPGNARVVKDSTAVNPGYDASRFKSLAEEDSFFKKHARSSSAALGQALTNKRKAFVQDSLQIDHLKKEIKKTR